MNFWLPAVAIPAITALVLCWPMLRGKSQLRGLAVAMLLLIPITTLFLYQHVGAPEGADVTGKPQTVTATEQPMQDLVEQLRARLEQQPDNLDGWLLLARSHKTLQQYDLALEALRNAAELAPDNPVVKVELAEALIFTSGSPHISAEIRAMLQSALRQQPDLQKGLWLLGIIAYQDEDFETALGYWERLLPLLDPASGAAGSVREQIEEARSRLGLAPDAAWAGVETVVLAPPGLGQLPPGAALFVIARDPAAPAPPLGAVRVPSPVFPVTVRITDANSMMAQRPISSVAAVEIYARLSLSGQPQPMAGDPASQPVRIEPSSAGSVELKLSLP